MVHRSHVVRLPLLAMSVALTGCAVASAGDGGTERTGNAVQAIMGGQDDATDLNVVDIVWDMGSSGYAECSGALLAPNMVLTAHHCVSMVQNGANGVDCSLSSFAVPDVVTNFYVSTQEFLSMNLTDYHTVREIVVPPDSTNSTFCGVDQAILILSDNVAATEAVPLVPRVDSEIAAKDTYSAIGFGITSASATDSGTRRRLDNLLVDCVGSACSAIVGDAISTEHEWLGDHGTCEGDSGGPALDDDNRVVGVTSRGGADCTTPIYGDVYSWADWIKQTATLAAQLGDYAAPLWVTGYPTDPAYSYPVGGSCSTAACPSDVCLEDAEGSYCSRECETAAPCPTGYACETVENLDVCQRVTPATTPSDGPSTRSGCTVAGAQPIRPVPAFLAVAVAALALLRRRLRQ